MAVKYCNEAKRALLTLVFILSIANCDIGHMERNLLGHVQPYPFTFPNLAEALGPASQPFGAGSCLASLNFQDCPMYYPGLDLITLDNGRQQGLTEWVNVFTYEIKSNDTFGKCRMRLTPQGKDVYLRRYACYNLSKKTCMNFDATMKLTADSCGRARLETVAGDEYNLFYSQDPTTYLWQDLCLQPSLGGGCGERYFDLLIRSDRVINPTREADLSGLPWDKIATDLAKVMRKRLGQPDIRFTWIGQGKTQPRFVCIDCLI